MKRTLNMIHGIAPRASKNQVRIDGRKTEKSTSRRDSESQKVPALIQKSAGTPEHCLRRLWQKAHLR